MAAEQLHDRPSVREPGLDFELRPLPVMDCPMFTWVQHCATCDYCAIDIGHADARVSDIIALPAYQQLVADGLRPVREEPECMPLTFGPFTKLDRTGEYGPLVEEDRAFHGTTDFLCKSFIDEQLGSYSSAAWAQMHSAWLYDVEGRKRPGKRGRGKRNKAAACRSKALTLFRQAWEQGQGTPRRRELEMTVQVELLRRNMQFDEAEAIIKAHEQSAHSDDIHKILRFQQQWIEQQDAGYHMPNEVPGLCHDETGEWVVGCQLY